MEGGSLGKRNHLAVLGITGLLIEIRIKEMVRLFLEVAMFWLLGERWNLGFTWSRYSSGVLS